MLEAVSFGLRYRAIGLLLGISAETVKCHCDSIRFKLGARNQAHAVAIAWRRGLIP